MRAICEAPNRLSKVRAAEDKQRVYWTQKRRKDAFRAICIQLYPIRA